MQVTKTCLVPLLISDQLYKSGYSNIKVLCLCKPKYIQKLINLTSHLDVFKNKLVEMYPRMEYFNVIKMLKQKKYDFCLLSYHQDNPLNFLHLETLYLRYGLIHNTKNYSNAGYYYSTIEEGVKQLKNCFENHSQNI